MDAEARNTWAEYARRKRAERLSEAEDVWRALRAGGVDDETVLAVDFVHFGPSQSQVESLALQLSENYTVRCEAGRICTENVVRAARHPHLAVPICNLPLILKTISRTGWCVLLRDRCQIT